MRHLKNSRGIFLIETLVMMGILTTALTVFGFLSTHTTDMFATSQKVSNAIRIGSSLAEELLSRNATDPQLTAGTHSQHFDSSGKMSATPSQFEAQWEVVPDTPSAGIAEIRLNIRYKVGVQDKIIRFVTRRKSS